MSKHWSASQAKGFHNFIVHVHPIHGSLLQCSLHGLVMGIWEPLKNFMRQFEALAAFDHLNCQILTQIFLKSNAQEGGHGWFWNWLGHKSRLWGVLGRAWAIDELNNWWQSVSITDIDYLLIIIQLILLVNVFLWLLSVIGYQFHQ